jgi:hypothetical protein
MPSTSQKNDPLSLAGADLGMTGDTPGTDAETEEEKKKRLALLQQQQMKNAGTMSMAATMLGIGGG